MEYLGAFWEYQEALSRRIYDGISRGFLWNTKNQWWNTKRIYGIPRTCPEISRSFLKYQEALTKNSCKFVSRFRPHKVKLKRLKDDAKPGQYQAQMPSNGWFVVPRPSLSVVVVARRRPSSGPRSFMETKKLFGIPRRFMEGFHEKFV